MKKLLILIIFSLTSFPLFVSAHQSGCHRWHSCPSDSGSYICGDLGYTSGCPSYAPVKPTVRTPAPKPVIKSISANPPSVVDDFAVPSNEIETFSATGTLKIPASFRRCPSTDCSVIRYYAETSNVSIIGKYKKDNWYQISGSTDAGGTGQKATGWISQSVFGSISPEAEAVVAKETTSLTPQEYMQNEVVAVEPSQPKEKWYRKFFKWLFN